MNKTRTLLFGSALTAAMIAGGVIGGVALAKSPSASINNVLAAASPTPTFKSNEDATHEKGETAAQEAAENSGQRPGGNGGHPNETAAHEAGESAAREAAENAGVKPSSTP
jgi:hypothetical protein